MLERGIYELVDRKSLHLSLKSHIKISSYSCVKGLDQFLARWGKKMDNQFTGLIVHRQRKIHNEKLLAHYILPFHLKCDWTTCKITANKKYVKIKLSSSADWLFVYRARKFSRQRRGLRASFSINFVWRLGRAENQRWRKVALSVVQR